MTWLDVAPHAGSARSLPNNSHRYRGAAGAARPCRLGAALSVYGLPRAPAGRTTKRTDARGLGAAAPGLRPETPGSRAPGIPAAIDPGEAEQTCPGLSRSFSRGVLHLDRPGQPCTRDGGSTAYGHSPTVSGTAFP